MWWIAAAAVLAAFILTLIIRAASFRPLAGDTVKSRPVKADTLRAAESLSEMIRCKTVSSGQDGENNRAEFEKFRELLITRFPAVNKACTLEYIGDSGILYTLKGKSAGKPSVFMAHYDVVPADESRWEKPPFDGMIENGVLWGRGALDTKSTLCAALEAVQSLLSDGFVPENDIYFAFSGDEEVYGPSAAAIVDVLDNRGVKPGLVLDEGGAVVENVFPGVTRSCALIGIAEKGVLNTELSVESRGGHASAPPAHTPVGVLARAALSVENKPFRHALTEPVRGMFDTLGRYSSFANRLVFANLWCFLPLLSYISKKKGGEFNAMLRTTCAFTVMEGSSAYNVLPPKAHVGANLRLLNHTQNEALAYLKAAVGDEGVTIKNLYGSDPSPCSKTEGPGYEKLVSAVAETWPGAVVSPYLMLACSDSRHYCRICDCVYRFSAMELTPRERSTIHGHNEKIELEKLGRTVEFYIRLIEKC